MRFRHRVLSAVAMVTIAGGACETPVTSGTPAPQGTLPSTVDNEALRVARAFTDALNRGDGAAARALVEPSARFDSVGRVYPDRDAIFERFLDPEVIAVGGQYAERSTRTEGGRLVVKYDFTTRSGGRETFTYAYQIRDGLIADVIGRYV